MRKKNGPTLIIGVGGTGRAVVSQIFKFYRENCKNDELELTPVLIDIEGIEDPIEVSGILLPQNAPLISPKIEVTYFNKLINRETIKEIVDNPTKLFKISPRNFEKLVGEIYRGNGFKVTLTQFTRDGGIDILMKKTYDGMLQSFAVQCKCFINKKKKVGVGIIRSLLGVIGDCRVTAGILVTNTSFTKEAINLVKKHCHRVFSVDLDGLLGLMRRYLLLTA